MSESESVISKILLDTFFQEKISFVGSKSFPIKSFTQVYEPESTKVIHRENFSEWLMETPYINLHCSFQHAWKEGRV